MMRELSGGGPYELTLNPGIRLVRIFRLKLFRRAERLELSVKEGNVRLRTISCFSPSRHKFGPLISAICRLMDKIALSSQLAQNDQCFPIRHSRLTSERAFRCAGWYWRSLLDCACFDS